MPDKTDTFQAVNGKRKILIVEDELINREILRSVLETEYEILTAENGREAMEIVRENRQTLSLILLDLLMPIMSGTEVLQSLKEDMDLQHIPVIVMTADQQAEIECLKLGAIDFIPKPYPQAGVIHARVLKTIELSEDRRLIQSTERDPLTGLYNRDYFYQYAEQYDLHHQDREMDAILLDINHFHIINERFGKTYGDDILRKIGETTRKMIRKQGGIVCRRNADTFMIYCPHREDYREILDNVSVGLVSDTLAENRVRLRMGVYSCVDKNVEIERRFDRAKIAADSVKGNFAKTIGIYDNALHKRELFEEQLVEDFRRAIDEKEFRVFYQPKYNIRQEKPKLYSAEALVRWQHPQLGLISPAVFIPLFEQNGMIAELDAYVWRESARQIRLWKEQYGLNLPVSVNVSRIDLYNSKLSDTLQEILRENNLAAPELMLEITESAYTQESAQIIEAVNRLRSLGFRIEMDDFGTGYSSLNMLSTLPIDALKLDMQFVRSAFKDGGDTRMLEVIIDIAAYLSVPVIAEGVETAEQMQALKIMGCDLVQGYFFSKPVPPEEFVPFIGQRLKEDEEERKAEEAKAAERDPKQDALALLKTEEAKEDEIEAFLPHPIRISGREETSRKEYKDETDRKSGWPLRSVSFIFVTLAFLIAAALFISDNRVTRGYERMEQASSRYITAQQAAADMESGSDYLTDRVRCFVVTGDISYLNDFFEEVEVTKRRDQALTQLEEMLQGSNNSAYASLATALDFSNELVNIEYKAMRLTLEALKTDLTEVPPVIAEIVLSEAEKALSASELRQLALDKVFDDTYTGYKDRIRENVRLCTKELISTSSRELDQASARMNSLLTVQTTLVILLLLLVLLMVVFISLQVRKPLTRMVEHMQRQETVPPTGAQELRFVTATYNHILKENQKAHEQLTYEASHDALTGLFNRRAFEMLSQSMDQEHIALLIVDVYKFKKVNDTYGHDVGDRVLKRVAEILRHSFRSVDVICRIGGDEFAVIMTRANSSMRQLVINKIHQANELLENPKDDLPPAHLSVGVAFADRPEPQGDIFKDADTALYRVKNGPGYGCEIF